MNLALHALAGILLVEACLVLGVRRRAATLGGLLFLAHPLTSLVAGAIAFRSEALVAAGLFGAIVAHRRGRPLLVSLLLAAAALAKETGFVLAPLFVATIEWQQPTPSPLRWRLFAAEGAGLCLALALRLGFAPAWPSGFPLLSLSEHWGSRLALIARATTLLFLPVERGVCDAFPITGLLTPSALFGAALGIAFLVFAGRRGALGWLTILAFLPALQLVPTLRWWSPHYFYLGAGLFFVLIAERAARARPRALRVARAFRPRPRRALLERRPEVSQRRYAVGARGRGGASLSRGPVLSGRSAPARQGLRPSQGPLRGGARLASRRARVRGSRRNAHEPRSRAVCPS
ncbi:MAG: hypothetical protein U0263_06700 [Polyangiaceae bacterium]